MTFAQGLAGIMGTWLLAFGLKSMKETQGSLDTSNPHPQSWRFWAGLILLTLAALPSLMRPLARAG